MSRILTDSDHALCTAAIEALMHEQGKTFDQARGIVAKNWNFDGGNTIETLMKQEGEPK